MDTCRTGEIETTEWEEITGGMFLFWATYNVGFQAGYDSGHTDLEGNVQKSYDSGYADGRKFVDGGK